MRFLGLHGGDEVICRPLWLYTTLQYLVYCCFIDSNDYIGQY